MALDYLVIKRESVWGRPGTDAEHVTWTRLLPLQRSKTKPEMPSGFYAGAFETAYRFETRRSAEDYIKSSAAFQKAKGWPTDWRHVLAVPALESLAMTYPALFIEITSPFKDSMRAHMHRACLDAFADRNSEFWRNGKPRRNGTAIRRAFWRGFDGKLDAHEPDSMVFAAARAGRDMGKQWREHLASVLDAD